MVDVRIKPLEWEELHSQRSNEDPTTEWNGGYEADSAFGYYEISMGFGSDAYYWTVSDPLSNDIGSDFEDPSDAKDAAQADYERRIRSALSDAVAESEAEPVASRRWDKTYPGGQWLYFSGSDQDGQKLYTSPPTSELEALRKRVAEIDDHRRKVLAENERLMNALIERDRRVAELEEVLIECEEYFDNRADADHDGVGFVANEEMNLQVMIRRVREGEK